MTRPQAQLAVGVGKLNNILSVKTKQTVRTTCKWWRDDELSSRWGWVNWTTYVSQNKTNRYNVFMLIFPFPSLSLHNYQYFIHFSILHITCYERLHFNLPKSNSVYNNHFFWAWNTVIYIWKNITWLHSMFYPLYWNSKISLPSHELISWSCCDNTKDAS